MKQIKSMMFIIFFMVNIGAAYAQFNASTTAQKNFQNKALKTSFKYDVKAPKKYKPLTVYQEMVDGKKFVYTIVHFDTILAMLTRKNTR